MDDQALLPVARFDSSALPTASRFEAYRALSAPFLDLHRNATNSRDFDAISTTYLMHNVAVNLTSFGPLLISRPERRGFSDGHAFVNLHRFTGGWHRGLVDDQSVATRGDALLLVDGATSSRYVTSQRHCLTVMFPYAAIGYDPSRHPRYLNVPLDSAMGRVLDTTLQSVVSRLPDLPREAAYDLAEGLSALVRALFHLGPIDDRGKTEVDVARGDAMRAWLDARLTEDDLGTDDLCRAFNVSRATAYRLFAAHSGVARYIRRRRLESALHDLLTAAPDRGRVRAVAERWGFHDPSHFHRLFREEFGMAPSDAAVLDAAPGPDRPAVDRRAAPHLLSEWQRGL